MPRNYRYLVACGLMLGFAAVCVVQSNAQDQETTEAREKYTDLVNSARAVYESKLKDFKNAETSVDQVYVWSDRLLKAEQYTNINPNAAADHQARMQALNDYVLQLKKKDPKKAGAMDLQTKYYLLESEIDD